MRGVCELQEGREPGYCRTYSYSTPEILYARFEKSHFSVSKKELSNLKSHSKNVIDICLESDDFLPSSRPRADNAP